MNVLKVTSDTVLIKNGTDIGILNQHLNRYIFQNNKGRKYFENPEQLTEYFKCDPFKVGIVSKPEIASYVNGYPAKYAKIVETDGDKKHNVYCKISTPKIKYCAGYYVNPLTHECTFNPLYKHVIKKQLIGPFKTAQ